MTKETKDIVKSNALIEASYHPGSLWQMRLLLACLIQIKATEKISDSQEFVVTANALADMTGQAARSAYRHLKRAANELRSMYITVDLNPDGSRRSRRYREINVIGHCDYLEDEGRVSLSFTRKIIPYISELKTRFTQYQTRYVMPMRSSYGIRLYELCLEWFGDTREYEVDDFRETLGLTGKYKNIEDLKRRVIKPALKDINTCSDIRVRFGQRKSGRTVTHFQFQITRLADKDSSAATPKKMSFDDYVKKHSNPGETWDQAKDRLTVSYQRHVGN